MTIHRNSDLNLSSNSPSKYLLFQLEGIQFATKLSHLKEITEEKKTTPLPKTPDYYLGISNFNGNVLSLIDLKLKLKIKNSENGNLFNPILIVNTGASTVACKVDRINEINSWSENEIDLSNLEFKTPNKPWTEFVYGTVKTNSNTFIYFFDIKKAVDLSTLLQKTLHQAVAA